MFQMLQIWDPDSAHQVRWKSTVDAKVRDSKKGLVIETTASYNISIILFHCRINICKHETEFNLAWKPKFFSQLLHAAHLHSSVSIFSCHATPAVPAGDRPRADRPQRPLKMLLHPAAVEPASGLPRGLGQTYRPQHEG